MAQSDVRGGSTRREPGGGLAQDERPGTGASTAGGDAGGGGGQGRRRGRRRGGGRRIVRWFALVLSVLILGTAGAGYLYYRHLNGNIDKGKRNSGESDVEKTGPNAAGQTPLNILLIGSDSRNSAENVKLGGSRDNVGSKPLADVQMLLHVSADRESASVVSIPRDTRVDIPKCVDPDTGETYPAKNTIINETLQRGGPGCTLATWQNLTGVYIDHWMMVDFAGVVDMADAIGGVPVCVNQNVWDRPLPGQGGGSGLKLKAGTHKVQGKEALQWLRTRHAWGSDPLRAKAQHMYMNAMIRTLKEQNVFTDTGRLMGLAEAGTKALKVSEEIGTVKELYDVGMQLKSVPTNRITMTTMPWIEDPLDRNHLVPKPGDADKMWAMLRDDVSFDKGGKARAATASGPSPASVQATGPAAAPAAGLSVTVVNGTASDERPAVPQRATAIVAALQQEGFTQAVAASRQDPHARTQVTYPRSTGEQGRANALSVAEAVGIPSSQVRATDDVTTTLTIGSDWREGTAYPKQKAPEAGDLPDSADALSADKTECMDVYKPYRW
ncbi:LCP family protein [Streptomyces paradoxus]|uniref:LCP family protein required for cell wall assembly n=1 Tax=Streptomyces paradoxus TaxID=66375 RepID=A0A7W9TDF3_9ACTN|nr:LCP family protein [Streptomyces paradoxus]MBB6078176.1 LCP family protein required for cell wall assembly [Streptomyces paradoxus]